MTPSDYLNMPQNQPHLRVMAVLRRWDPIGVISDENQDEYDSYSVEILHMLDRGASVDDVLGYMKWAVTDHMGMSFLDEPHSRSCAEELVNYWKSLKGE